MRIRRSTLFALLAGVVTLAGVIAGFTVIGPPSEVRMRRFDEMRVEDLVAISNAVTAYRRTHEGLPQTLDDMARSSDGYRGYRLKDPTGRAYEYAPKDKFSYDLCSEFDLAADDTMDTRRYRPIFSMHKQGKQCFSLEARPQVQR